MGLRMKSFSIMRVHWKIRFLGGFTKNQYIVRDCLKRGLGQFSDLRRDLAKKRGWCFWRGLIPKRTLWIYAALWKRFNFKFIAPTNYNNNYWCITAFLQSSICYRSIPSMWFSFWFSLVTARYTKDNNTG